MKNKVVLITTLIFFIIVNTSYFWMKEIGVLAMVAFIFLALAFIVLGIVLLFQLYYAAIENFKDKGRNITIGLLTAVLLLTYFKPEGIIEFEKLLEGKDLLIAQREGAANCTNTMKLTDNGKFIEKSVCFGIAENKGDYQIKNDTIFFKNVSIGTDQKYYYQFAVIKPSDCDNCFELALYDSMKDTIPYMLPIIKNDLKK